MADSKQQSQAAEKASELLTGQLMAVSEFNKINELHNNGVAMVEDIRNKLPTWQRAIITVSTLSENFLTIAENRIVAATQQTFRPDFNEELKPE